MTIFFQIRVLIKRINARNFSLKVKNINAKSMTASAKVNFAAKIISRLSNIHFMKRENKIL